METGETSQDADRARRRFEALAGVVDGGVFQVDADGRLVDVDEAFVEQTGYTLDDTDGRPLAAVLGDDRIETVLADLDDGTDAALSATVETADGNLVPTELRVQAVTAPATDGNEAVFDGAVGVVRRDGNADPTGESSTVAGSEEFERRMEDAEAARRRYETLVENVPNGAVALVDDELRFVTVGGSPLDPANASASDLEGERVRDVLDDEFGDVLEEAYRRALDGERSVFEHDVGDHVARVRVFPVRDDGGDVVAAMGMSQDVTAQKAGEQQLEKYETIFETLNDGIYVTDEDLHYETVNDAFAELTGYSRAELRGEHASIVVSDETLRRAAEVRANAAEGEATPTLETTVQTADGDVVPVEVTFSSLESRDGDRKHVGVVRDISDREERRRRIEENERRYRTLVENFPNGAVGLFDDDLRYTAVGGELLDETDVSPADRVGRRVHDIYPDDVTEEVEPHFEAVLEGEARSFDIEFHDRLLSARVLPIRGVDGAVDAGMLVVQDLTERREHERRLERTLDLLEKAERTADVGGWEIHPGTKDVFWSDQLFDILGVEADEEPPLEDALDVYHEDDRQLVADAVDAALESGEPFEVEVRFRRPSGEVHWLRVQGEPETEDGEVVAVRGAAQDITEQKEYERFLEDVKAQMEAAAEAGAVGTWEWHISEDRFVGDAALARLFGVDAERARDGVPLDDLLSSIHEDDRARVAASIERAVETGDDYEEEYRVYDADGDVRWVVARGNVESGEDGNPVTFPGAITDITDQKRVEQEIDQHREQLERLFEVLPVGVVVADADGAIVEANDVANRLLGEDGSETSTVAEYDRYDARWADSGDQVAAEEYTLARVLRGEQVLEPDVYRTDDAAGNERVVEARGVPVVDDGEVVRGVVTLTDVTEREDRRRDLERRAHQQQVVADLGKRALETDDLDDLMAEAAREVADVLDNDYCKVLDLDDADRELLLRQGVGWDDGIVGTATVDADDDSQAGYTLRSEEPVVVEDLESEDRFGGPELLTTHDVTSGVSTIIGSIEEPWGILGTHDTSSKQFAEEDVNFVQSVANILADAIERERYDAEREALVTELEESNERLEQFAYAASHDLQEPLRMVSSYLTLIEDRYGDELDDDAEEFLAYAVDGADRMQEMINALLEYSRVERDRSLEPVDLEDVFADVRRDFQMKIEDTDATVVAESLPTVAGDEDQLRQVLGNLVSNGLEYSGDEPPTVRVSAERDSDEWVVAVSDDGIGIEPEQTDRIFEVFQRLHTHDEHPGTGVGLALVQRIVERHGGDVWVDSTPGEGSTFYFSIPDSEQRDD